MTDRIGTNNGAGPGNATASLVAPLPNEITPNEAALIAGVSPKTIREWVEKIDALGVKRVGRWKINRRNLQFILVHGVDRYLERLATVRAKKNETHEKNETHRLQDNRAELV